jgi:hypothetical protein
MQPAWLARLELENDNLRAIMRRALRRGDPGVVAQVGSIMWLFWYTLGRPWVKPRLRRPGTHDGRCPQWTHSRTHIATERRAAS